MVHSVLPKVQVNGGETTFDNSDGQIVRHVTVLNLHIMNSKRQVGSPSLLEAILH